MPNECKKIYITTPIYYVNDVPHIGHAYTTVIADTIARYSRLVGYDTFFLTGTDEHGQKIEEAAKKRGKSPKEYADEVSKKFRDLWDHFEITYDKFIRTTQEDHAIGVQKAFLKMYQKGDIYKSVYKGNYCISCEAFFTETQLVDHEFCPECGKSTTVVEEESYFFKLSKYQDKLLEWLKNNEKAILPKTRRNEVIRFIESGLEDLSITRTSFEWGIKLPKELNDPKHVIYVWLDALMNYLTALGYGTTNEKMDYWPAKVHLIGKDILRFHAIYWPAFLMSLDLPLPHHIAAHGWWTRNGEKMSKSKGNVIDPKEVADAYGLDNFRYFMLREVPFGGDGDFSQRALIDRINSDLGNDLGNLLNRTIAMAHKFNNGVVDSIDVKKFYLDELNEVEKIIDSLSSYIYDMQLHRYLEEIWKILSLANKSIDRYQPWNLVKEDKLDKANALIALISNILARVAILLSPVMPKSAQKMAEALNIKIDNNYYKKLIENKELLDKFEIKKIPPLFPKVEKPLLKEPQPKEEKKDDLNLASLITIDQFFKSDLRVGTIIEAQEVKKSKKLLKLKVDLGENRPRDIVAGIKEYYTPDELINQQVCVVANLKPAKIMGMVS
ncbi:MAG: methionine--tRNA ligase, partial [Epsilonproteobacteria bacterium]|nr:methionine--tRNA ligase [Campylobacterota bacterium]